MTNNVGIAQSVLDLDARYTVTLEHCGYPLPSYVARFCDKFIVACPSKESAEDWCFEHWKLRQKQLGE